MMSRRTRSVARVGIVVFAAVAVLGTAAVASAGDDHPSKSKSESKSKSKDASKSRSKSKSKSDHPGSHTSADMPGMKMSGTKAGKTKTGDKGLSLLSNGHHSEIDEEHAVTPADRKTLSAQISATIDTARKYPTVADALAAGYQQVGPYMPGIGAHFINYAGGRGLNPDGVMDDADLANPLAIVYDGTAPQSVIAGFMYYSMSPTEPAGFAGANDVWHYHESLCLKFGPNGIETPYGLDRAATKKQCTAAGANLMKQSQWMLHVWSVPGWESRQGLFGEVNPALMCADGTYYQLPPKQWLTYKQNICRASPA